MTPTPRPPAPLWRVVVSVALALSIVAALILFAGGAFTPNRASAALPSGEDCATALTYPDRTAEERAWLELCVGALRPYTPPPSPTPSASASPSASPSVSPSASPTPPAPPAETATYTVDGRRLKDPRGETVVARGAEQVYWNASWLPASFVTEMGRSAANTVRILPYYTMSTPTGEPPSTLAQIEDMIRRGINAHMMVDVAIDKGERPATYLRPEVKAMLFKYQKWIVIHAKGESYEANDNAWVTASNTIVANMRAAGYTAPLYVYANEGGRNLPTILRAGQRVVDADPLHRIVFGWQAYWGPGNYYQNKYGCPTSPCTLPMAFAAIQAAPFPIQVGLIEHADMQDGDPAVVNYSALMADAQARGIGWLWWDWRMSPDDLTNDGVYGHWVHRGLDVVVNNVNSINRTSVRTPFQLAQAAP